jgi:hypothetical protein
MLARGSPCRAQRGRRSPSRACRERARERCAPRPAARRSLTPSCGCERHRRTAWSSSHLCAMAVWQATHWLRTSAFDCSGPCRGRRTWTMSCAGGQSPSPGFRLPVIGHDASPPASRHGSTDPWWPPEQRFETPAARIQPASAGAVTGASCSAGHVGARARAHLRAYRPLPTRGAWALARSSPIARMSVAVHALTGSKSSGWWLENVLTSSQTMNHRIVTAGLLYRGCIARDGQRGISSA